MIEKDIIISYAKADSEHATRLRGVLSTLLGDTVWMRDFDLDGGELIVDAISEAFSDAKWLIIILSKNSVRSPWIKREASYGTFRALETDDFKILTVKLEECTVPEHLRVELGNRSTLDLSNYTDVDDGFIEVANFIQQHVVTISEHEIYEGRGADADQISLVLRRNKVIFVLGWRGIGKTAFVQNSVKSLLHKSPRTIKLTVGHSLDLLARQIIQVMHVGRQPMDEEASDAALLARAISAIRQRADRFFLFFDNAQFALDETNIFHSYLATFLDHFLAADIDTHVLIATTQSPRLPISIHSTSVHRLGILEDEFITEIVLRWLEGTKQQNLWSTRHKDRQQLLRVISGHPFAARRMSVQMKLSSIDALVSESSKEFFHLGFAEYILRSTNTRLDKLHIRLLQILAVIQEPVLQADLLAVPSLLSEYDSTQIHQARRELYEWFLIEQDGELIFLHNFLITYYARQLRKKSRLRTSIETDFGKHAHRKALGLHKQLAEVLDAGDERKVISISNSILRYAVPADRLLRMVGLDDLADELPIHIKGTLRALIYYFFQEVGDYEKALKYADQWLTYNPDDLEIQLYRIRCHRKGRKSTSFQMAKDLLDELEPEATTSRFLVKLKRERGLIAQREGDYELARGYFKDGIRVDSKRNPYSEIHASYAKFLIIVADTVPDWSSEKQRIADEAVEHFEIAKRKPDNFYRFHLDAYGEALIQAGQHDKALPLLESALRFRPRDKKLNWRMAVVKRRNEEFEEAKNHAQAAYEEGFPPSLITFANILFDEARANRTTRRGSSTRASLLNEALKKVNLYFKQYKSSRTEQELEVANTVKAKILREQGNIDAAHAVMWQYKQSNNPYSIFELSLLCLKRAEAEASSGSYADALSHVKDGLSYISNFRHQLPSQLDSLQTTLLEHQEEYRQAFGL